MYAKILSLSVHSTSVWTDISDKTNKVNIMKGIHIPKVTLFPARSHWALMAQATQKVKMKKVCNYIKYHSVKTKPSFKVIISFAFFYLKIMGIWRKT